MRWHLSHQYDKRAVPLADRHYSRSRVGTTHFAPPGRMLVLLTKQADALWITSWPYPEMLRRDWFPTAWMCTLFRNEGPCLSSELIREAVAATRWYFGNPPPDGMVTIIDQRKIKSVNPGYCYKQAGFVHAGYTKKAHLVIVRLLPENMPEAFPPSDVTMTLDWQGVAL
jgi:hypothetical protein